MSTSTSARMTSVAPSRGASAEVALEPRARLVVAAEADEREGGVPDHELERDRRVEPERERPVVGLHRVVVAAREVERGPVVHPDPRLLRGLRRASAQSASALCPDLVADRGGRAEPARPRRARGGPASRGRGPGRAGAARPRRPRRRPRARSRASRGTGGARRRGRAAARASSARASRGRRASRRRRRAPPRATPLRALA